MKLLKLFLFFTGAASIFKNYHHPTYHDNHNQLSEGLKKESRKTFVTLSNAMYESRIIKEKLSNKSSEKKNYLLNEKMNQRRKMDRLFAGYQHMVQRNQIRSRNNLLTLEKTRKFVSDHLSNLKNDHLIMKERLKQNDAEINDLFYDKTEKHYKKATENYHTWKRKNEEIEDIIKNIQT
jgi:hypothetical protein